MGLHLAPVGSDGQQFLLQLRQPTRRFLVAARHAGFDQARHQHEEFAIDIGVFLPGNLFQYGVIGNAGQAAQQIHALLLGLDHLTGNALGFQDALNHAL